MSIFSGENALKLLFLIAPTLYFVNAIIAISFSLKYKEDSIHKKNASVWFFYVLLGLTQGGLQEANASVYIKTLAFAVASFFVMESMSLFLSDIFKVKSKLKSDSIRFIGGAFFSIILFYTTDSIFVSALPAVFAAAYPVLRLIPLIKFYKNNNFTKNGYLIFSILIALHILDYAYAVDKPNLMFPGYLIALMLATGASCFSFAVLIERAIMEVEIKDLLHNTSRLVALGGMAAEIAHEIKNPLTVLTMNNYQLRQKLSIGQIDDVYLKSKVEVYDSMTNRLISIMEALKVNYQSGDHDDYAVVTIAEIFEDVRVLCDVRANKYKINLSFETKFVDIQIVCRSVQITQVLQNLIHNAVDVLEDCDEKWIKIGLQINDSSTLEISVSDSGPGIPKEIQHKIFENLFTTKTNGKGTGLGLSISKRFMEEHNGYLRLDSDCQNTKFIIGLPLNVAAGAKDNNFVKKVS